MDYFKKYAAFLGQRIDMGEKPLHVVCDCSNGTAGLVLKEFPQSEKLKLTIINENPDGDFPAHGPNPLLEGSCRDLIKHVLQNKADIGVVFDADGDRAFFVDDSGFSLPSFMTSALLFKSVNPSYVADELVFQSLRYLNLFSEKELFSSRIGSRFLKEALSEKHANVGAEYSGHYYFKDFFGADSGLMAMIKIINILSKMDTSLSEFRKTLPTHIVSADEIKILDKKWENIQSAIEQNFTDRAVYSYQDGITLALKNGWVNVRPSNTEPIIRIIGGFDKEASQKKIFEELRGLVK